MKNKKIAVVGHITGTAQIIRKGDELLTRTEHLHGKHAPVIFVDDAIKNSMDKTVETLMSMHKGRGSLVAIVVLPEMPVVTWETPILEITQHPLFVKELGTVILKNVYHRDNPLVTQFYQLFPRYHTRPVEVLQEYYKITLKQSKCSSRMRGLIERIIKATCVTLIQKFDDGKRPAEAEKTAGEK